jgi:hypothetical protein
MAFFRRKTPAFVGISGGAPELRASGTVSAQCPNVNDDESNQVRCEETRRGAESDPSKHLRSGGARRKELGTYRLVRPIPSSGGARGDPDV